MSGVNKVILLGRLGADPETRYTAAGACVCSFRIATSEKWRDKETGELVERTEWHSITAFGRTGEVAAEFLKKGGQVYIEGSLRTEKYTDKEGIERYATKVIADNLQLLGSRDQGDGQRQAGHGSSRSDGQQSRQAKRPPAARGDVPGRAGNNYGSTRGEPPPDDFKDDIPF